MERSFNIFAAVRRLISPRQTYIVRRTSIEAFDHFWSRCPALLYGLAIYLGFSAGVQWTFILLIPFFVLILSLGACRSFKAIFLFILTALISFLFTFAYYTFPQLPQEGVTGRAHLNISAISNHRSHFGQSWQYEGKILSFVPTEKKSSISKNISYRLYLPMRSKVYRPLATHEYIVEGRLKEHRPGFYTFVPDKNKPWQPIKRSWSLAEKRFHAKKWLGDQIRQRVTNTSSRNFLAGIATGNFDDWSITFEFGRFGLRHIMAISGFHFAIIATVFSFLLQFIFPWKLAAKVLIALLTGYFLFLGNSPSIMRAWLMATITLGGYLLHKQATPLNSLGTAMIAVLAINPLYCQYLGFQFSFLATAAILIFYPITNRSLQYIFPKLSLSRAVLLHRLDQHGYILLAWFRGALALTLAVHLAVMPLILSSFHKFPWLSLIYNLFFPFLISIAIFLLLVALISAFFLPPIAPALFFLVNNYTEKVLAIILNTPISLDFVWYVQTVPPSLVTVYISILFAVGIVLRHVIHQRQEELQDFAFI